MDAQEERPPLVTCPHCGSVVPSGDFCGHCGAHLTTGSVRRMNAYTAAPAQGVARVAIISTLFPHLPQRRGGPFRAALGAGAALVALLAGLHLFAPATTAAVLVLPVLYLMYLYEVEVYESEPWLVVGATLVAGAFLGLVFTNLTGGKLSQLVLTGDRDTALVLAGVVIPVVAQLLMLAGPGFLYLLRGRFREPLDGQTFGAASALINACTTAAVAASIWLHRYDRRRTGRRWHATILSAVVVAFGVQIAVGVTGFLVDDLVVDVAILVVMAVVLLLYLRWVIHDALLVEGAAHEIGPDGPCPECHRVVPTMAFCPACGAARAAAPKQARRRVSAGI